MVNHLATSKKPGTVGEGLIKLCVIEMVGMVAGWEAEITVRRVSLSSIVNSGWIGNTS